MMAIEPANGRSGEERHRARFRALVRFCVLTFVAAFVAGIASGYVGALVKDGELPAWVIYITTGLLLAGFIWFLRDYLRRVDEVDRLDNLWAGLIGFTAFYVAFPVWNALAAFDLAPPVDVWMLWIGTTIVMLGTYLYRKVALR